MEIQATLKRQNNLEKEQNWRTHSFQFQTYRIKGPEIHLKATDFWQESQDNLMGTEKSFQQTE